MTTYLITYGRDLYDRFSAMTFAKRADALLASRWTPPVDERGAGGCHLLFEGEEEGMRTMSGPTMVALYNRLTGETVTKFESKAIGVRRVIAAFESFQEKTMTNPEPETAEEPAIEPENVTAAAEQARHVAPRRAARFTGNVVMLVTENPLKEGKNNHAIFARLLADGPIIQVARAYELGANGAYLKACADKNWLRIDR